MQSGLDLEETLKSWEPSLGRLGRTECKGLPACPPDALLWTSGSRASQKASMALSKAPVSLSPFVITATYRALLVSKHSESWVPPGAHKDAIRPAVL